MNQSKSAPICKISELKRFYGGIHAVDIDELEIQEGIVTSIIGPNGAGKTTLFNLITGFEKADSGRWSMNGVPLENMPPHKIARTGMVRTFQLTKTLDDLTVMESMLLASQNQDGEKLRYALLPKWRSQEARDREKALSILESFGLIRMQDELASSLSGGQRKLLEICKALMCDPKFILLDEPLAGVNPALIEEILKHIKQLKQRGLTVAFIEHNMDAVIEVSDWVVCLSEGSVIAECEPKDLLQNEKIIEAYLGTR